MVVRPADHFVDQGRATRERGNDRARDIEGDVVARARHPDHDVVLRRRHDLAGRSDDRRIEVPGVRRSGIGRDRGPDRGPEPDDEIDAIDRRARFTHAGDERHGRRRVRFGQQVELEPGVRRRPEREDPRLR